MICYLKCPVLHEVCKEMGKFDSYREKKKEQTIETCVGGSLDLADKEFKAEI